LQWHPAEAEKVFSRSFMHVPDAELQQLVHLSAHQLHPAAAELACSLNCTLQKLPKTAAVVQLQLQHANQPQLVAAE
jgi:hypothetical protein